MNHLDPSHVSTRHQRDVDGWKAAAVVKLASVCKVIALCLNFKPCCFFNAPSAQHEMAGAGFKAIWREG